MTNEQPVTIEEELRYIHEEHPGYLERFLTLMAEGRIDGDSYLDLKTDCGCFYGHLFSNDQVSNTWSIRNKLAGDRDIYTPIEQLIARVLPDETPQDNAALSTLKAAIEHVLLSVTV